MADEKKRWYRITFNDHFVGYEIEDVQIRPEGFLRTTSSRLLVRSQGASVEREQIRHDFFNVDGFLQKIIFELIMRGASTKSEWSCDGCTLKDSQDHSLGEWSERPRLPSLISVESREKGRATLWALEPISAAVYEYDLVTLEKTETSFTAEGDWKTSKISSMHTFDAAGDLLREEVSYPGLRLGRTLCGEEVRNEYENLLQNPHSVDIIGTTLSRDFSFPDIFLSQEICVEVTSDAAPDAEFLGSLKQYATLEEMPTEAGQWRGRLRRTCTSTFEADAETAKWLGPDEMVTLDVPELEKCLREILGDSLYETARDNPSDVPLACVSGPISHWAGLFFTGGSSGGLSPTAALLRCEKPSGDCGNTALLQIAAFRHLGIPARMAYGFALMYGAASGHAWLEVHHGGRWHGVDLLPGGKVGATHFRLVHPWPHFHMKRIGDALGWLQSLTCRLVKAVDARGKCIDFTNPSSFEAFEKNRYRNTLWRLTAEAPPGFHWETVEGEFARLIRLRNDSTSVTVKFIEMPWSHPTLLKTVRIQNGWKEEGDVLVAPTGQAVMRLFEDCAVVVAGEVGLEVLRSVAGAFRRLEG